MGLEQLKLLGLGHIMVDSYIELPLDVFESIEISEKEPEHLGPEEFDRLEAKILQKLETRPEALCSVGGGASIAASTFSTLGGSSQFFGTIGGDAGGAFLREVLEGAKVGGFLWETPRPTGRFRVYRASERGRAPREKIAVSPSAAREIRRFEVPEPAFSSGAVLHIDGVLIDSPDYLTKVAKKARAVEAKVSLDVSTVYAAREYKRQLLDFAADYCDFIFANEDEFAELFAADLRPRDVNPSACWIEKRGGMGSRLYHGGDVFDLASKPADFRDTTGAGDAFAAGFLFALQKSENPVELLGAGAEAALGLLKNRSRFRSLA